METKDKIIRAKVHLQSDNPFFAYLVMHLNIKEDNKINSIGVDNQGNMIYNKKWIDNLSDEHLKSVLCHEICHLFLAHFERGKNKEHEIYNIAGDLVINNILVNNGFNLPKGLVPYNNSYEFKHDNPKLNFTIEDLDKKSADEVYNELMKKKPKEKEIKIYIKLRFDEHNYGKEGKGKGEGDKDEKEQQGKWKKIFSEASIYCFDDKTEILTENGWRYFKELKENEKVATLHTATKKMSFQTPTKIITKDYNGDMIYYKNKSANFCVTPEHRFFIEKRIRYDIVKNPKVKEMFVRADELSDGDKIRRCAFWENGENKNHIIIDEYKTNWLSGEYYKIKKEMIFNPIKIKTEIFCDFLGWYLSEGCYNIKKKCGKIVLTQFKKDYLDKFKSCLNNFSKESKYSYRKYKGQYTFSSVQLANYFSRFGKSRNKFIPREIKSLNPKYLKILLNSLLMGDGHQQKKRNKTLLDSYIYYTNSKQLANDVQEIALKCGRSASIRTRIMNNKPFYNVMIYQDKKIHIIQKKSIGLKKYKGKVYCVSVPNEVILVRRNGQAIFTGNCKQQGTIPNGIERLVDVVLNEKISWKNLLYKYITRELMFDYSYAKPSKRSVATNIYMPSTLKENLDIVVAVDTSGSIEQKELSEFLSEIVNIAKSFSNINMKLIVADCEIKNVYEVRNGSVDTILNLKIVGGGGTSFITPLNYIKDNLPNTKFVIYFTDGYGDKVEYGDYPFKLIWVITKNGTERYIENSGDVVKLED